MKKLKFILSTLLIVIMQTALLFTPLTVKGAEDSNSAIIADHNNATLADLNAIPAEWISSAKSNLHIYYNHTSHGSQITSGMTGLAGFKGNAYAWNANGSNGALQLADTYNTDLGNKDWPEITRSYLKKHPEINIVMWSWCGQVSGASEDYIKTYLNAMDKLEKDYPKIRFVYMTGHTDGSGVKGNLHIRNEQIRQYCRANNKILFDFADIESYDPDGKYYMDKAVNDECKYDSDGNGSRESNWATAWQNSHVENTDWYSCGSAHSQPLNANMKAYAAWYLWARLAGWSGGSSDTNAAQSAAAFNDLSKAYAKAEIEALASKDFYGWIKGGSFYPNRDITRGEFLYLLVKALELDSASADNFTDVKPSDFYFQAAATAKQYGISNGMGNNKLGGELNITRQEMSTMVARALKAANKEYPAGSISDLEQFSDAEKISSYAKDSLAMLVKAGVLKGYNNALDPRGTFTMQQAALVIWRVYNEV